MTLVERPRRGTRPANRRELILAAATSLFSTRGYEKVSIGDVAEAVAVGPSALYRHFSGKDQLLAGAIIDIADRFTARTLPDAATFTLDNRELGVLWEREARHLPAPTQAAVRDRIRDARHRFIAAIREARPDLPARQADTVTRAVVAVLLSPSFHAIELPRPAFDALMTELAGRVLATSLPDPEDAAPVAETPGLQRAAKRERLLAAAVRLFAERSYARVSMEDVAEAVGISASSVYNYFPTKVTLLATALDRANGHLQVSLDDILARSAGPADALRSLAGWYTRFALAHPDLLDVLITESGHLTPDQAAPLLQAQHEYVGEWVHLLREIHPGLDAGRARVVVHATLKVIHDLARTPAIRSRPDAAATLTALGASVLTLSG